VPEFHDARDAHAPPEEVWKILYDPSRFPDWWAGVETVDTSPEREAADRGTMTLYPDGYPDFPMPQDVRANREDRRVTISCLVSELRFSWHLEPVEPEGTHISVDVLIPEQEAHRLDTQRDAIRQSLENLATLAETA
jgi:uncharacterized protein YndB with AHSA1/START domain